MKKNSSILITGGIGLFGQSFVPLTSKKYNPKRLVIYSKDRNSEWMTKRKLKLWISASKNNLI